MKNTIGTFPDSQSAELACGRIKEECGGGKCKINANTTSHEDKYIYSTASQFGLSISPETTTDPGAWSSVIPVPDTDSGSENMLPCELIFTGTETQAENAAHVMRSLGALNIRSCDA